MVDLGVSSAEFIQSSVRVLSVNHDDVGTPSGRDHLKCMHRKMFNIYAVQSVQPFLIAKYNYSVDDIIDVIMKMVLCSR